MIEYIYRVTLTVDEGDENAVQNELRDGVQDALRTLSGMKPFGYQGSWAIKLISTTKINNSDADPKL